MLVTENDISEKGKLACKRCDVCDKPFKQNQSYEVITAHSKRKLIIHTDCIRK